MKLNRDSFRSENVFTRTESSPKTLSNKNRAEWNLQATPDQQAARPASSREVTYKTLGNILKNTGNVAEIVFLPIIIPLSFLSAGIGFAVGKGMEKLMDAPPENAAQKGMKIGGNLAYALTGALISCGDSLSDKAKTMKQDRKDSAQNEPHINLDEALAGVPNQQDAKEAKEAIEQFREAFIKGENFEIATVVEDNGDHAFNNFLRECHNEITLNNEILELGKKIKNLNYNPRHQFPVMGERVTAEDRAQSRAKLNQEAWVGELNEKKGQLEKLKDNTNRACIDYILNDPAIGPPNLETTS